MPNWTNEQFRAWQEKRAASDAGQPCPKLQKLQVAYQGKVDHKPEEPKVDGGVHSGFQFSIDLLVSDERERDGDGAEATLLDCVIHARKRLLSLPDSVLVALYESLKKPRGMQRKD